MHATLRDVRDQHVVHSMCKYPLYCHTHALIGVVFKLHLPLGEDLDLGYSGRQDPTELENPISSSEFGCFVRFGSNQKPKKACFPRRNWRIYIRARAAGKTRLRQYYGEVPLRVPRTRVQCKDFVEGKTCFHGTAVYAQLCVPNLVLVFKFSTNLVLLIIGTWKGNWIHYITRIALKQPYIFHESS